MLNNAPTFKNPLQLGVPQIAKYRITIWLSNAGFIHNRNEVIYPHKNLYTNVHRNIIHDI